MKILHLRRFVRLGILLAVLVFGAEFVFFSGNTSNPEEQLGRMSPDEREYCEKTLGQITSAWSDDEVEKLLGKPSRDLSLKKNWWVTFDDRRSRVGVYFNSKGNATEIVFDGVGFYYRRPVPSVSEPTQQKAASVR